RPQRGRHVPEPRQDEETQAPPEGREQRDSDAGSGSHLSSKSEPIPQLFLLRWCRELAPEVLERRLECDDCLIDVGLGAYGLRVSRCLEVDEPSFDVLPGGLQAIDRGDFCLCPLRLGLRLELVDAGVRRTNLRSDFVLVGLQCGPDSRLCIWRLHVSCSSSTSAVRLRSARTSGFAVLIASAVPEERAGRRRHIPFPFRGL